MMTVVLHQEPVRISNTHRRVQILLFQQSLAHTHRFHWILLMHPTHKYMYKRDPGAQNQSQVAHVYV